MSIVLEIALSRDDALSSSDRAIGADDLSRTSDISDARDLQWHRGITFTTVLGGI